MKPQNIQFSLDNTVLEGTKVGRLYMKAQSLSLLLKRPYYILDQKTYNDGQIVIRFIAGIKEYRRLAEFYPHSDEFLRIKTQFLLRKIKNH